MAATPINKEDGSCVAGANTYALAFDGDQYHLGHLYASAWVNATLDNKSKALIMATRLIDAHCRFLGFRKSDTQALQWPRVQVLDCEASGVYWVPGMTMGVGPMAPVWLSSDSVPQCVADATCELARELLIVDRTAAPLGEGLKSSAVTVCTMVFDRLDRRPVLTATVKALLSRVLWADGGTKLVRA